MAKQSPSWRSELANLVVDPGDLGLPARATRGIEAVSRTFPLRIPTHLLAALDPEGPRGPIGRQLIPDNRELAEGGAADPLGEEAFEVEPGVIQRFEDRLLALVSSTCPVHCRHCNRKRFWKEPPAVAGPEEIARALRRRRNIREVILSGGEPLLLSDRWLRRLLSAARSSKQVELVRIHTRIPWSLPSRVTDGLVRTLKRHRPLWLSLHFNHARELTAPTCVALSKLREAGLPMLNQAVLLRGINDSVNAQLELGRALVANGVKPHYLFQLDRARGTLHFQVPMPRAAELIGSLQGRYSGLLIPHLLIDLPGRRGKVPVTRSSMNVLAPTSKNDQ
jgi:lysine 2,3-aminomutase